MVSAAHINGIMMDAMLTYNAEILDFMKSRVSKDSETAQHLMACNTPEELTSEIGEYLSKLWVDYPSEVAKLANIGVTLTGQAIERFQEENAVSKAHLVEDMPGIKGVGHTEEIEASLANVPV